MDEVVFRVYSSAEALAQALRKGEIDIADSLDANIFNSLKGVAGHHRRHAAKYSGLQRDRLQLRRRPHRRHGDR